VEQGHRVAAAGDTDDQMGGTVNQLVA
jgi:hypothetical protein